MYDTKTFYRKLVMRKNSILLNFISFPRLFGKILEDFNCYPLKAPTVLVSEAIFEIKD